MKASEIDFRRMMIFAAGNRDLAEATSFVQVEHGLKDLEACWDGFVETSDYAGLEFKNKTDVCTKFCSALVDHIEFTCAEFAAK